jgi:hypothetical protein
MSLPESKRISLFGMKIRKPYLGSPVDDDCCFNAAQNSVSDAETLKLTAPQALHLTHPQNKNVKILICLNKFCFSFITTNI